MFMIKMVYQKHKIDLVDLLDLLFYVIGLTL